MEKKETDWINFRQLRKGEIIEANKILLDLFGVSCSNGRTYPTELKLEWYQKLIGAFKNRKY